MQRSHSTKAYSFESRCRQSKKKPWEPPSFAPIAYHVAPEMQNQRTAGDCRKGNPAVLCISVLTVLPLKAPQTWSRKADADHTTLLSLIRFLPHISANGEQGNFPISILFTFYNVHSPTKLFTFGFPLRIILKRIFFFLF